MQQQQQQQPDEASEMFPQNAARSTGGTQGGQLFAARPKLVSHARAGPYAAGGQDFFSNIPTTAMSRDPYREYVKVQPQNIMYDRRVVRGNTFAALVIPVNMQPDPTTLRTQQAKKRPRRTQQQPRERNIKSMGQNYSGVGMENVPQEGMTGMMPDGQMYDPSMGQQYSDGQGQPFEMQIKQRAQTAANEQAFGQQVVWEELQDYANMVDERYLEPDYYIDRPPASVYVPPDMGSDKATYMDERNDPDLFDFKQEAEPILQVLVGKALEHARIEVIEEYEADNLEAAKQKYKQKREAELIGTQRVEAARVRKMDEVQRRALQQKTMIARVMNQDRKDLACNFARQYLRYIKRDTLESLTDLGVLRSRQEYGMGVNFIAPFYKQVLKDQEQVEGGRKVSIDQMVDSVTSSAKLAHRDSIKSEMNRREKLKLDAIQRAEQAKRETQERKTNRQNLREKLRIHNIEQIVLKEILFPSPLLEWKPAIPVLDVRQYIQEPPHEVNMSNVSTKSPTAGTGCVYLLGGMIGEMVVTLNCLQDVIRTRPDQGTFSFTQQDLENYFMQVFAPDQAFPSGAVNLELLSNPEMVKVEREEQKEDPESPVADPNVEEGSVYEEHPITNDELTEFALNPCNLASFGLRIIVENQQELEFDHDLVKMIFTGIINVARYRGDDTRPMSPAEHNSSVQEVNPDEDPEGSQAEVSRSGSNLERSKSAVDRSMIQALSELRDKFKVVYRTDEQQDHQLDAEDKVEKCLIKISNHREETTTLGATGKNGELVSNASQQHLKQDSSQKELRSETPNTQGSKDKDKKEDSQKDGEVKAEGEPSNVFNYEELPPTTKMFSALQPLHDMNILIQHVEAGYQVRKHLFDVAQKVFQANMQEAGVNSFMQLTGQKNTILNTKMDEFLAKHSGFGAGQKYEDRNAMIVYKTFLESNTDDKSDLMELLETYAQQAADAQNPEGQQ